MLDLLLIEWVTKMKPGSNSVEDHPSTTESEQASNGWCTGGYCGHKTRSIFGKNRGRNEKEEEGSSALKSHKSFK